MDENNRRLVLLSVFLVSIAISLAKPSPEVKITAELAGNHTSCQFTIEENINESRNPRLIKEYVCKNNRKHHCKKGWNCAQIIDKIPVTYDGNPNRELLEIKVGCGCVFTKNDPSEFVDPDIL